MRYRLLFIIGALIGYVLGARAGRTRFDEIKDAASDVLDDPRVQKIVDAVTPDPLSTPATTSAAPAPAAPTPAPSPAPKPGPAVTAVPPLSDDLPTVSTDEPLTTQVEDALDPDVVAALEDLAEREATDEDEARAHRDDA